MPIVVDSNTKAMWGWVPNEDPRARVQSKRAKIGCKSDLKKDT